LASGEIPGRESGLPQFFSLRGRLHATRLLYVQKRTLSFGKTVVAARINPEYKALDIRYVPAK